VHARWSFGLISIKPEGAQMDTNENRLHDGAHAALTYAIVGGAMEVLNELGHGLHEKPYERSLVVEFALHGFAVEQQRCFKIPYKDVVVGEFIPDLIVNQAVVVDTKVIDEITDFERGQMLDYLRITKLRVGVIVNFKRPKLEWERIVL
jgi:GxxExxY protein